MCAGILSEYFPLNSLHIIFCKFMYFQNTKLQYILPIYVFFFHILLLLRTVRRYKSWKYSQAIIIFVRYVTVTAKRSPGIKNKMLKWSLGNIYRYLQRFFDTYILLPKKRQSIRKNPIKGSVGKLKGIWEGKI